MQRPVCPIWWCFLLRGRMVHSEHTQSYLSPLYSEHRTVAPVMLRFNCFSQTLPGLLNKVGLISLNDRTLRIQATSPFIESRNCLSGSSISKQSMVRRFIATTRISRELKGKFIIGYFSISAALSTLIGLSISVSGQKYDAHRPLSLLYWISCKSEDSSDDDYDSWNLSRVTLMTVWLPRHDENGFRLDEVVR